MVEELTGYKKKMAMLGFRMIEEEEKKNQAANNGNADDKTLQKKARNNEFK